MIKQPTLEELFALNADGAWRASVNCYGFAIGATLAEAKASPRLWGPHPGDLSHAIRRHEPHRLGISQLNRTRYLLLADGLIPIRSGTADLAKGHIIAACDNEGAADCINQNSDYHFFRRVAPGSWAHKEGQLSPITTRFGMQAKLTNIHGALIEFIETCNGGRFIGMFRVPASRRLVGDKSLPRYTRAGSEGLTGILLQGWLHQPNARANVEEEASGLGLDRLLAGKLRAHPHLDLFSNTHGTSLWLPAGFKL